MLLVEVKMATCEGRPNFRSLALSLLLLLGSRFVVLPSPLSKSRAAGGLAEHLPKLSGQNFFPFFFFGFSNGGSQ